jgi:hypothetical protein
VRDELANEGDRLARFVERDAHRFELHFKPV